MTTHSLTANSKASDLVRFTDFSCIADDYESSFLLYTLAFLTDTLRGRNEEIIVDMTYREINGLIARLTKALRKRGLM